MEGLKCIGCGNAYELSAKYWDKQKFFFIITHLQAEDREQLPKEKKIQQKSSDCLRVILFKGME